jgi:hypothetical protein
MQPCQKRPNRGAKEGPKRPNVTDILPSAARRCFAVNLLQSPHTLLLPRYLAPSSCQALACFLVLFGVLFGRILTASLTVPPPSAKSSRFMKKHAPISPDTPPLSQSESESSACTPAHLHTFGERRGADVCDLVCLRVNLPRSLSESESSAASYYVIF